MAAASPGIVAGWPWNNANPTYTFRDQVAKIWGSHNVYIGVYIALAQKNENNGAETQGFLNFRQHVANLHGQRMGGLPGRPHHANFSQTNAQTKIITIATKCSSRISRTIGASPTD